MRAGRRRLSALAALALSAATLGALAPAAGAGSAQPTNLGVKGDEFSLIFSRPSIAPGPSLVQFQNAGEDVHDLVWKRVPGQSATKTIGTTLPGEVSPRTSTRFKAGAKYRFWCTIADHRERGMKATLTVRR